MYHEVTLLKGIINAIIPGIVSDYKYNCQSRGRKDWEPDMRAARVRRSTGGKTRMRGTSAW